MYLNNIQQISRTAGSGAYACDSIITNAGVLPVVGHCAVGKKYRYKVQQLGTTVFELNEGTFTVDNTLTRDRLIQSSTGSPIAWPDASDKIISIVSVAEDMGPEGGRHSYVVTTGTSAAYVATTDVPVSELAPGTHIKVKIHATNAGACTLDLNTLGAKPIKKRGNQLDPEPGELPVDFIAEFVLDPTAAVWQVLNPCSHGAAGVKMVTTDTYNFVAGDAGKLIVFTNAAGCAAALPEAINAFGGIWWTDLQNASGGAVVVTPATSTIDGVATLTLPKGAAAQVRSAAGHYRSRREMAAAAMSMPVVNKAAAWPMVAGDVGTEINFTTAAALTLLSAAAIGAGNIFGVRNSSPGDVTLTGTVRGITNPLLRSGDWVWIRSDGAALDFINGKRSFKAADQAFALAINVAHGLGELPTSIGCLLKCTAANLNYAANEIVDLATFEGYSGETYTLRKTPTQLQMRLQVASGSTFYIPDGSAGGTPAYLDTTKWVLVPIAEVRY